MGGWVFSASIRGNRWSGVRRGYPKFFLESHVVGADSRSRAVERRFRLPIVRRCASRPRPLSPPWRRGREALPPGTETLGMKPQLCGHFRGCFAAGEPPLHSALLERSIKLRTDLLSFDHRLIHTLMVFLCLCPPNRRSPTSPYEHPGRHWELDADGQPTDRILSDRRKSAYLTPVPSSP